MGSLRETMREFGDTQHDLAKVLGVSDSTMSLKIRGISDFTRLEVKAIVDRYSLSGDDIKAIFFEG